MESDLIFCVIQHGFDSYHHSYLLNDNIELGILGLALNLSEESHCLKLSALESCYNFQEKKA